MYCLNSVKVLYNQIYFTTLQLGSTAIGIQTNEGIVFAVEKRVTSTLMKPVTIEKIVEIEKHIGTC